MAEGSLSGFILAGSAPIAQAHVAACALEMGRSQRCTRVELCKSFAYNCKRCLQQQRTVANWGLKLAVSAWFSCQGSYCLSLPARPPSPTYLFDNSGAQRQWLSRAFDALLEEVYTTLRGLYLLLLFLPVILASPVCVGLGWKRASWVQVLANGGILMF